MGELEPSRSFDRTAEEYERVRPEYPAAILDPLPLGFDAEVLDLGAGTGKLTRLLVSHYRRVVAVEPLDGMRGILERVVPAAESLAGSAEAIPLADAAVDGVFAGQAFHWFAHDEAVSEIGRVLRPGGILCVVWNESLQPLPLPDEYDAYLEELHGPRLAAIDELDPWPELIARGPFTAVQQASVLHEQVEDRDNVLAYAQTLSWVARRADGERARIARDLDALLGDGPFRFPLSANVTWAVRT